MPIYQKNTNYSKSITVFTEDDIALIEEKAATMTLDEIADLFGITTRSLFDIRTRQEEVDKAYRRGRAKAFALVGGKIFNMCKEGNEKMLTLFARTKMGWSEKNVLEFVQTENSPKVIVNFADEIKRDKKLKNIKGKKKERTPKNHNE